MTRTYGRLLGLVVIAAIVALQAMQLDAWARAAGGRSTGSRGSRSYSRLEVAAEQSRPA